MSLRVAAICQKCVAGTFEGLIERFLPVDEIRYPDAPDMVKQLAEGGFNLVLLSSQYLKWQTDNETSDDDIYAFERALAEYDMSVICLVDDTEYSTMITSSESFHSISLDDILRFMVEDYQDEWMFLPYGMEPYFIIPTGCEQIATGREVDICAGFQPWTYSKLPPECFPENFLFHHWLPVEYKALKVGPIPFRCY